MAFSPKLTPEESSYSGNEGSERGSESLEGHRCEEREPNQHSGNMITSFREPIGSRCERPKSLDVSVRDNWNRNIYPRLFQLELSDTNHNRKVHKGFRFAWIQEFK